MKEKGWVFFIHFFGMLLLNDVFTNFLQTAFEMLKGRIYLFNNPYKNAPTLLLRRFMLVV